MAWNVTSRKSPPDEDEQERNVQFTQLLVENEKTCWFHLSHHIAHTGL